MVAADVVRALPAYREELSRELETILDFWMKKTVDTDHGGFIGSMDNRHQVDALAPKGIVLNSRILWTFSAAYLAMQKSEYLGIAARAFHYIVDHFIDKECGGVYWSVDRDGTPLDTRKQIYGLAFCLYGFVEYYKASQDAMALYLAKELFTAIEQHSYDERKGGYIEAFTRDWKVNDDLRLSEKDDNEMKTANTHLHIIEAYANLYTVWRDEHVEESIKHLLDVFDQHMIDQQTGHLHLFMDEDWQVKSSLVSFGHEIEAGWLLLACAGILGHETYIKRFREISIKLTKAAIEGLDDDGGLWYEYEATNNGLIKEKHWWPQAEALVGFLNAYEVSGNEEFLHYSLGTWDFIKQHTRDNVHGEWYWGIKEDYSIIDKEKAGFWKCPYHNGRACLELMRRIDAMIKSN